MMVTVSPGMTNLFLRGHIRNLMDLDGFTPARPPFQTLSRINT